MSIPYNPFTLESKTILVTGASSGIGRAIAVMCSKMGAEVIATGRALDKLEDTLSLMEGGNNSIVAADLSLEDNVRGLVESCPKLDGVVHCAGVSQRGLLKSIEKEEVEYVMRSNFEAPVLLQKTLLQSKKIKKGASLVFIASRAPFAPSVGNGIYSASKGALIAYSKVLALELADRLIRVNCICPGLVWTDLLKRDEETTGTDFKTIEKQYPLKRFGQPEDVAALTVYMLSDASSWMTGSSVDLAGGGELTLK